MFWYNDSSGNISSVNFDGSGTTAVLTNTLNEFGPFQAMEIDSENERIYFATRFSVYSIDYMGGDENRLTDNNTGTNRNLALDTENGKVYFTNYFGTELHEMDLDGSNKVVHPFGTQREALYISKDVVNNTVYAHHFLGAASVQKINLDNQEVSDVFLNLTRPSGIAFDYNNQKMFWTDNEEGTINSVDIDGSNQKLLRTGPRLLTDAFFDSLNQKIIMMGDHQFIHELNPDGSGLNLFLRNTTNGIEDFTFSYANEKIYWIDQTNGNINRANRDGSGAEFFLQDQSSPQSITVNQTTGKLYWTDFNTIYRCNLDGTNQETLGSHQGISASRITIDEVEEKIYWFNPFDQIIYRSDLLGENSEEFLQTDASTVFPMRIGVYNPNSNIGVVDNDMDGFNSDVDCDDTNADIYPGAMEIPNNNIDEDCDGVDLICPSVETIGAGPFCNIDASIDLDDLKVTSEEGSWIIISQPNGATAIISNNIFDATFSAAGEYHLQFILNNIEPNCPSSSTQIIEVLGAPNAGTVSPTLSFFEEKDTIISLFDLIGNFDAGGLWSDLSTTPAGNDFNSINGTLQLLSLDSGSYVFQYFLSGQQICPDDFVTVTIQILPIVDEDMDGFNSDVDCDDTNPNINPDAMEIPNNGIDEDCDGLDGISGLNEIGGRTIKVFPNPASDFVSLQLGGLTNSELDVTVFDILGKQMATTKILQGSTICQIDTRTFYAGEYFARISDGDKTGIVKFIIAKE